MRAVTNLSCILQSQSAGSHLYSAAVAVIPALAPALDYLVTLRRRLRRLSVSLLTRAFRRLSSRAALLAVCSDSRTLRPFHNHRLVFNLRAPEGNYQLCRASNPHYLMPNYSQTYHFSSRKKRSPAGLRYCRVAA